MTNRRCDATAPATASPASAVRRTCHRPSPSSIPALAAGRLDRIGGASTRLAPDADLDLYDVSRTSHHSPGAPSASGNNDDTLGTRASSPNHEDLVLDGATHPARPTRAWPPCPRHAGRAMVHRATGASISPQCKVLTCYSCIVPRAIGVGRAIALARPTRSITLTQVGETWRHISTGMARFRQRLRRLGVKGEYCYHVEPNPEDTGYHAHLFYRDTRPPQPVVLRQAAASAGFGTYLWEGPAKIPTEHYEVPSVEYGLKMILWDRPDYPTELWPAAATYLTLNGGRLTHATTNFWLDREGMRTDQAGATKAARPTPTRQWAWRAG